MKLFPMVLTRLEQQFQYMLLLKHLQIPLHHLVHFSQQILCQNDVFSNYHPLIFSLGRKKYEFFVNFNLEISTLKRIIKIFSGLGKKIPNPFSIAFINSPLYKISHSNTFQLPAFNIFNNISKIFIQKRSLFQGFFNYLSQHYLYFLPLPAQTRIIPI